MDPAHGYWRALKNPAKAGLAPRVNLEKIRVDKVLEPAPQGMGAPQATGNTQRNDAEAPRSLHGRSRFPPMVHLMPATMVYVRYYTT